MSGVLKKVVRRVIPKPALEWWGLRNYRRLASMDPAGYRGEIERMYEAVFGRRPDLDSPVLLTEKIQWLKLWDSTPGKGELTDKYAVRSHVTERLGEGYLVPLVLDRAWESTAEIPLDDLPNRCVLKLTTGSGFNYFVGPGHRLVRRDVEEFFSAPLLRDYALNSLELHYSYITPRIIAEEFLDGADELVDYRFWCSWGEVFSVWVDTGSWNHDYRRTVFDLDWNVRDVVASHPRHDAAPPKPRLLDEMMRCARELSRGYALVRVDLYERDDRVFFGEMTFTPQSGLMRIDREFDLWMGAHVRLPDEKAPFMGMML